MARPEAWPGRSSRVSASEVWRRAPDSNRGPCDRRHLSGVLAMPAGLLSELAAGRGLEPRSVGSKPTVLPLNEPASDGARGGSRTHKPLLLRQRGIPRFPSLARGWWRREDSNLRSPEGPHVYSVLRLPLCHVSVVGARGGSRTPRTAASQTAGYASSPTRANMDIAKGQGRYE